MNAGPTTQDRPLLINGEYNRLASTKRRLDMRHSVTVRAFLDELHLMHDGARFPTPNEPPLVTGMM